MKSFSQVSTDISRYAGSIGCIVDRCLKQENVLGTAWLIDPNKVATCAHLLVLYADCLPALKVRFPAVDFERDVINIAFHPQFNLKLAEQMARKALSSPVAALPLQEYNLAVLTLGGEPMDLNSDTVQLINERLSLPQPAKDKGLGGSLSEIDLPLIIQTITNARKEGTLVLSDERNRPLARLFCKDGKVMHACYCGLQNETAIYQIVSQHLIGNFYFQSRKDPDWPVGQAITRPTDMLLIESHRRYDEIPKLLLELGGDTSIYQRAVSQLNLEVLAPDVRKDAQVLWPFLNGLVPLKHLWKVIGLDDYAIFQAVAELLKTNHVQEVQSFTTLSDQEMAPLKMAPELPLSPFDDIENLAVEPLVGQPIVRSGHLLGSLRPGDPWHLLHDLELPADCSGSPIFKEGQVIGIHCGTLPARSNATTGAGSLNQLLWVESVYECLNINRSATTTAISEGFASRSLPAGCTEVARIDCPRCGASSLDSAKFCKSCGQPLIQDLEEFNASGGVKKGIIIAAIAAVVLLGAMATGYFIMSNMHTAPPPPVSKPCTNPLVSVSFLKADKKTGKWMLAPAETIFRNGDLISLQMKLTKDCFVYVLHEGVNPGDVDLLFPETVTTDIKYRGGTTLTIPRENMTTVSGGAVALNGLTITGAPGAETVIYMISDAPSSIYSNPKTVSKVYQIAAQALGKTNSPAGVEIASSAFGEDVFPGASKSASTVYLTRAQLVHSD